MCRHKEYLTQETTWRVDPTGLHFPSTLAILHRSGSTQRDRHYLRKHPGYTLLVGVTVSSQLKHYYRKQTFTLLTRNCNWERLRFKEYNKYDLKQIFRTKIDLKVTLNKVTYNIS